MELKSEKRIYASINLRLRKLGQLGPLLQGTPVRKYRKCAAAGCPCRRGRKMHPFLVISTKVERKTRTLYVPVAMEETALAWVRNFRAARRLVAELSSLSEDLIRTHAGRARAASRRAVRGGSSAPGTP
ncbi:MAG: hypothetical protein QM271_05885 [Bacillota bacterium]|nr:hypothetical protein [Bacillota bacterium]